MTDAEMAKAFLVDDVIIPIIVKPTSESKLIERQEQVDFNSFEPKFILKIEYKVDIESNDEYTVYNGGYFFTDWHLNNQELQRSNNRCFVYDGNKIYKSELLRCDFSDIQRVASFADNINLFETQQPIIKIVNLKGTMTAVLDADIAKHVLQDLKTIYFVPKGKLND